MTMHKSKGLQFDHVVLYGLGRHSAGNRQELLTWFDLPDPHGGEDKVLSPVGRRDAVESDPLHRFIGRVESRKDAHEQARLLYVACTRAKQSLHLVGHIAESRSGDTMGKPNARSHLALLWPAVESDYADAFGPDRALPEGDGDSAWLRPRLKRFDKPWQLPAVPAPASGDRETIPAGDSERIEYAWVGSEARIAGTIIHRWLDHVARERLALDGSSITSLRPITTRWARELGGSEPSIGSIVERVDAALTSLLEDDRGRWLLHGPGDSELALTGVVDGRTQNVIIDRVRIDDDGTHWIVDYKTSSHLGGNLDNFIAEEIRRYTPQMTRYATIYSAYAGMPARCALYFPLLQRFEEVVV